MLPSDTDLIVTSLKMVQATINKYMIFDWYNKVQQNNQRVIKSPR